MSLKFVFSSLNFSPSRLAVRPSFWFSCRWYRSRLWFLPSHTPWLVFCMDFLSATLRNWHRYPAVEWAEVWIWHLGHSEHLWPVGKNPWVHIAFMPSDIHTCQCPDLFLPSSHVNILCTLGKKITFFSIVHIAGEVGTYCSSFSLVGEVLSLVFLYTAKVVVVEGSIHKALLTNLNAFKFTCFLLHWSTWISLETWISTKAYSTICICPIQHFPGEVAESTSDWFIGSHQLHSPCWDLSTYYLMHKG